jgi:hypothetical protein
MERTLRSLTAASVVTWSLYLLYIVAVIAGLSEWLSPSEVFPTVGVPVAMLAISLWVGIWSRSRLPARVALLGQLIVLALGCLFIASAFIARAA